jgi:hypothetical protein
MSSSPEEARQFLLQDPHLRTLLPISTDGTAAGDAQLQQSYKANELLGREHQLLGRIVLSVVQLLDVLEEKLLHMQSAGGLSGAGGPVQYLQTHKRTAVCLQLFVQRAAQLGHIHEGGADTPYMHSTLNRIINR